jgi:hypothetical protein
MKITTLLLVLCLSLCPAAAFAEDARATLSWDANPEPDLAGYHIYQSTISGQYGAPIAQVTGTTHNLTLPQLKIDQRYFFVITAVDLAGQEGEKSDEVSKLVPALAVIASAPTIAMTPVSETEVSVSWAPLVNATGIEIRLMPAPMLWGSAVFINCPSSPCRVPGLTPDTMYAAAGVAYNGQLNVDAQFGPMSAIVQARTLKPVDEPPTKPKGLTISKATETQVVVTASLADCPRVTTSTAGSSKGVHRRTVACVR